MLTEPRIPTAVYPPLEIVEQSEHLLSTHPEFGDSTVIERRVLARYRFAVEVMSDYLPSVAGPAAAVASCTDEEAQRLFHDPGLRLALENAVGRLESGELRAPDPLEDWLPAALDALDRDPSMTYTESRVCPPGPRRVGMARSAWVGPLDRTEDPLLQDLRANLARSLPTTSACLAASPTILRQLETACSLLTHVLPSLGPAVLGHIAAIGVIETRAEEGNLLSASGGDVAPSTMVVSPRQLESPWDAAGHLLHEGLHLKLFDVARMHSFFRDADVLLDIPWRRVQFTLSRVLFSFHVYVHMLVFKAAVDGLGSRYFDLYGEPGAVRTRAQAMSVVRNAENEQYGRGIDRTRFLCEQLSGPWSAHLSSDGSRLVEWLTSSVERLAPAVRAARDGAG